MADLLETASNWLEDQRTLYRSRTVTYQRGADTVDVPASIGRTTFEVDDGYGVVQKWESRDFLILAGDLILAGVQTLPQRGDRILETQASTTYTYEVLAPGKEPPFRFSDAFRKTFRIHTKQIGA